MQNDGIICKHISCKGVRRALCGVAFTVQPEIVPAALNDTNYASFIFAKHSLQ